MLSTTVQYSILIPTTVPHHTTPHHTTPNHNTPQEQQNHNKTHHTNNKTARQNNGAVGISNSASVSVVSVVSDQ